MPDKLMCFNKMYSYFRYVINRVLPIELRNWLRIKMGRHPIGYRTRWPEISRVILKPGHVVIDVGGNVGDFVECCLAYQPLVTVYSFEPLAHEFHIMQSKFSGYRRIFLENKAVGSKVGELSINVSKFSEASSFLEQEKVLEDNLYGIDFSVVQKLSVPVIKFSDYIKENEIDVVRLLKIDTQGFELEVLKGAKDVLSQIEYVYLEGAFQPLYRNQPLVNDLQKYLSSFGFKLESICEIRVDKNGDLLECDMLFWNRNFTF